MTKKWLKRSACLAALAPIGVVAYLNQYQKRYVVDTTPEETPLPGDDLLTDEGRNYVTMSIDIDAPPERVWPLINQIGQNKAGFYSFVTFERMVHFLITNTYVPMEKWQDTKVGDWTPYGQQGIGHEVVLLEPGKYFVGLSDSRRPPTMDGAYAWTPAGTEEFAWTWGFFLEEIPGRELDGREPRKCAARTGKVLLVLGVAALAVPLWARGFDAIWGRHH